MIRSAIFTTEDSYDPDMFFIDGKPYLNEKWDWKKFGRDMVIVKVESSDQETMYNEELEGLRFLYTCLRRYNEVIGDRVQGFVPDALFFKGQCHEFRGNGIQSIKNIFMDWIGWESTLDHDEPLPITTWKKQSEVTNNSVNTDPQTNSQSTSNSTYPQNSSTNPLIHKSKLLKLTVLDESGNIEDIYIGG